VRPAQVLKKEKVFEIGCNPISKTFSFFKT